MKEKTLIGTVITGHKAVTHFAVKSYPKESIIYKAETQFESFGIVGVFKLGQVELDLLTNYLGVTHIPASVFQNLKLKAELIKVTYLIEIVNSSPQTPEIYYTVLNFQ